MRQANQRNAPGGALGRALGAHEQMLGLLVLGPRSGGDRHPGASSKILGEFVP
jgi:hypothetical protein